MLCLYDNFNAQIKILEKEENKVGSDSSTVKAVDILFKNALALNSSDIHIDFDNDRCNIRFRIDGILNNIGSVSVDLGIRVISRVKVLSGMDITQTRMPQDGRKTIIFNNKKIDIRVSTLPAKYGESVVLRLLPKDYLGLDLNELGLLEENYRKVLNIILKKRGIVLVVGPTGCGKTTTLYAILKHINDSLLNIVSLEDPIECDLPFVRQSQVKSDLGFTFSNALRSVLRQDPDVIMIGEIRDEETLNIAFKAALTGHMAFSTLHTTDTIETISRLREMGLPNYIISAALKGVVSQRLARKICSECNGAGCDKCNYNGLKGRIGLFEVLEIGENIASNILNNCSINNIKNNLINNGFCTIIDDALIKNKDNIINKDEILRVFGTYG